MHITVKCPSTQLVYNGQQQTLGYVYACFYNSQGRKVPVAAQYYYSINDGPFIESRFAEAINAGEYTIRYKVTAPGCEDAEGVFTNSITKSEKNPMTFVLDPCDVVVLKKKNTSASYDFTPANPNAEDCTISYTFKEGSDHENLYIPNSSVSRLVTDAGCLTGQYKLQIKATSESSNYETLSIVQELTFNLNSVKKVAGCNILDQDVTFLPAYKDRDYAYLKNNHITYYYDEKGEIPYDGLNSLIGHGANMKELSPYIKAAKDQNGGVLYASANEGTTFYGTVDNAWNNTFKPEGHFGVSEGLNSTFITALNDAEGDVRTVYFRNNEDTEAPEEGCGNWDLNDGGKEVEPKFGTVGYDHFYNAYSSLLSSKAGDALSSHRSNKWYAWCWPVGFSYHKFDTYDREYNYAVILTQNF